MGELGRVYIKDKRITVKIEKNPSVATLGCQLAGWAIDINGKNKLGSGPARILARKPGVVIDAIGYHESPENAAILIETDVLPNEAICRKLLEDTCAKKLIVACFSGNSMVGLINVMARVIEVAIYRLYNLGYDVNRIISASGTAPIPPMSKDIMFTANDALIYGGSVSLVVNEWDPKLTEMAISKASDAYGRSFKEIFLEAGDFYKVDPGIFATAGLKVTDITNGMEYTAGEINEGMVKSLMELQVPDP